MKINQYHLYHGAVLIQIAEHPSFTAINVIRDSGKVVRCAYWVNDNIGIYLRYRTVPERRTTMQGRNASLYQFQFGNEALTRLGSMHRKSHAMFLCMVCVEDSQICCVPYESFNTLVKWRKARMRRSERTFILTVELLPGCGFRVYGTAPNSRRAPRGEPILVARGDFPSRLFE